MTVSKRARRVPLAAEVVLAFAAGAASFALVAVALVAVGSDFLAAVLGVACVVAVVAIARLWGVAYAVPAAMAALQAFDWYQFPPTHPREFPDGADLADLLLYLVVAVLIGELAAYAGRRAEASEQARDELAEEQAALRRVATLVAGRAPPDDVFAAVAREIGALLDVDGAAVVRYGGDGPDPPDRTAATVEIVVDGRAWGAIVVPSTQRRRLPAATEARLAAFTDLVATAISNTANREELARLADEQAALRRVATLVASGVPPPEVFAAVARELGELLGVDATHMVHYDDDGTATTVAAWGTGRHGHVGTRATVDGESVTALVFRTGRPARVQGYDDVTGAAAAMARELGLRSSVGAPIVVDGRLWGVMIASSIDVQPLAADTESRIAAFTELVATAISNTEARTEVGRLVEEQAGLRRVATLVAEGAPPASLLAVVAEEVAHVLHVPVVSVVRYEADGTASERASFSDHGELFPVGTRWALDGTNVLAQVRDGCGPARINDHSGLDGAIAETVRRAGLRSTVGIPIAVAGRLWGAMVVSSAEPDLLPESTEARLADFTELVATAISNSEARAEVDRLADEQTALRRVATLVARESPAEEVFAAVAEELGRLLLVADVRMVRYEADETATVVAVSGDVDAATEVDSRGPLGGQDVCSLVFRRGRPTRIDDHASGTPIVVGGRLWGAIVATSREGEPLPAATPSRIREFTELVATAISNIEARSELAASRARIVAATDNERRRVVRDLHDGAQQRLVHTVITLQLARQALGEEDAATALVTEALSHAQGATTELRELVHGILPAVLTRGGLHAGVDVLASRMPVPVENAVSVERLPAAVEATAYFVVAEALTNVAKHAHAQHAAVSARIEDGTLRVQVRDDGVGGARLDGSGLLGLKDRLAVLDGQLEVESPADGGTVIAAAIPLATA